MEMAGYITPKHTNYEAHGRAATFAALNLTKAERDELLEYLKWKRSMRRKAG